MSKLRRLEENVLCVSINCVALEDLSQMLLVRKFVFSGVIFIEGHLNGILMAYLAAVNLSSATQVSCLSFI